MAKMRRKKKLTSKQANRISLAICAVYFIYMLVNGIISKPTGDQAVYYWMLNCGVGNVLIFFVFYFLVFKGNDRQKEEKELELEDKTIQSLSYTDFQQVYFLVTDEGNHINMMMQILQKEECKFYAKLTENKNIYLVVKDKHDEEVYNTKIENYVYFNHHFKFHE